MNPVLFVLDLHIVALGLLSAFVLILESREERERASREAEVASEAEAVR
ncbi:hypothetical protein SEA_ARCHERNM_57 [Mycobacterium phage ArcherNM]|nr:hypothetical protein BJD71_gp57 [Mycobacterium phage ArcherNM]AMS01051.1 hypothetical protein SEA_ARCHERNM_57 [Mycobacterium phage ArcherNM]